MSKEKIMAYRLELVTGLVVAGVLVAYLLFWGGGREALVVYCAHDSVYSEAILKRFEKATGIPVVMRFDTEATKSLGLVELLIREKENPRCDVFWNNEVLGSMDLKQRGILAPYCGKGWQRMPDAFKDVEGFWTGFAARLRVYIINTDQLKATPEAVAQALAKEDQSGVTMAKPLYGTTLTHYSVLWNVLGEDSLKGWHRKVRGRGLKVVASNGSTRDVVAAGVCSVGVTDTDDYFGALDQGHPVAALPVRLENGKTITIPNAVSLVKGGSHPEWGKQLIDYLLSEAVELALAKSRSRQIPLGPVAEAALPAEVRALRPWAQDGVNLNGLLSARNKCLAWLKSEVVR